MFCMSCGSQLPDGARFCNECGAAVVPEPTESEQPTQPSDSSQPSSEAEPVQLESDFVQDAAKDTDDRAKVQQIFSKITGADFEASVPSPKCQKYSHPYHRLGGWLGFIAWIEIISCGLLALSYLSGLPSFFMTIKYWGGLAAVLARLIQLTCFGLAAFIGIKLFFMIKNKSPRFLRFYEIQSLLYITGYLFVLFSSRNYGREYALTQGLGNSIVPVAGFLIGMIYFLKSVRVRTYMGSGQYLKQSIFLKNCIAPVPADTQPYVPSQQYSPTEHMNPSTDNIMQANGTPLQNENRYPARDTANSPHLSFLVPGIAGIAGMIGGFAMMLQGSSMNENVNMDDVMNEVFSTGRVNSAPGSGMIELGQVVIVLGCLLVIVAAIIYFYKKSSSKSK